MEIDEKLIQKVTTFDIYEGENKDNMMHGIGTYTSFLGNVYQGGWEYDKMHGEGMFITLDKDTIKGEWNEGNFIEE